MRVVTTSAVGPLAWTMSVDSGKLSAHWPPVSGRTTDQPSKIPWSTSVTSGLMALRGCGPPLISVMMTPANPIAPELFGASWLGCTTVAGTRKYTFVEAQ